MALIIADRVKDTTTTSSTGTITLSGTAPTGYQNFSVIGNGNTTYYTIAHQTANEWEVGIGTYTSAGTTLARTTILASSNAGSAVNFSAGTKDVFVTAPAERTVQGLGGGTSTQAIVLNGTTASVSGTIDTGINGMSVGPVTVASGVVITVASGQRWLIL
jgi:hypothetical protein